MNDMGAFKFTRLYSRPSVKRAGKSPSISNRKFWDVDYGKDWEDQKRRAKIKANWTCNRCGFKASKWERWKIHAHHILSKAKLGSNTLNNLEVICVDCHRKEHPHMAKRKKP